MGKGSESMRRGDGGGEIREAVIFLILAFSSANHQIAIFLQPLSYLEENHSSRLILPFLKISASKLAPISSP